MVSDALRAETARQERADVVHERREFIGEVGLSRSRNPIVGLRGGLPWHPATPPSQVMDIQRKVARPSDGGSTRSLLITKDVNRQAPRGGTPLYGSQIYIPRTEETRALFQSVQGAETGRKRLTLRGHTVQPGDGGNRRHPSWTRERENEFHPVYAPQVPGAPGV